jgi:signal transduction histidine kinase
LLLLAPYILAVVLTLVSLRQAADRLRVQALYDELRAAHDELKRLHQQVREVAIMQERNRLAREIHDTLAHYLAVVNLQLEAAERLAPARLDRSLEQIRRARRLTLECLQEARRSVAALRTSNLEEPTLPGALKRLANEFSDGTGIAVRVESTVPDDTRVSPERALALYRVTQEGLTNVHKHAKATAAQVLLTIRNGSFELAVEDNGVGPPRNGELNPQGFGLTGLRERVELLGGQLSFGPNPSGGSRLAVVFPTSGPS